MNVYPAVNFNPLTDVPAACGTPSYEYVGLIPYDPLIVTFDSGCIAPGESLSFMFFSDCEACPTPGVYAHSWITSPTVGGEVELAEVAFSPEDSGLWRTAAAVLVALLGVGALTLAWRRSVR